MEIARGRSQTYVNTGKEREKKAGQKSRKASNPSPQKSHIANVLGGRRLDEYSGRHLHKPLSTMKWDFTTKEELIHCNSPLLHSSHLSISLSNMIQRTPPSPQKNPPRIKSSSEQVVLNNYCRAPDSCHREAGRSSSELLGKVRKCGVFWYCWIVGGGFRPLMIPPW